MPDCSGPADSAAAAGMCGDHDVTLLDENVEIIDWDSLSRYDVVGVTGMIVQKERMRSRGSWAGA